MKTIVQELSPRTDLERRSESDRIDFRNALDPLLSPDSIVGVSTRPLPYASSFIIEEVDVQFDDGSRTELVCKNGGLAAMLPEARRVKPSFLRNPRREIAVYESILHPLGISAPRYYGAVIDEARDRFWLFLERVDGPPLTEIGDFNVWLEASAWLARLHTVFGQLEPTAPSLDCLPLVRHNGAYYRRWMRRAGRFAHENGSCTRARRERIRWLAARHEHVVAELSALPVALIHGEFYASNILVESSAGAPRIRAVDWELAAVGCPLMDLAALTAGWAEDLRNELACSYHAEQSPNAPTWLPPEAFTRALDCCRVQLAIQYLGWAEDWSPPESQARDWLDDAVQTAEQLGL